MILDISQIFGQSKYVMPSGTTNIKYAFESQRCNLCCVGASEEVWVISSNPHSVSVYLTFHKNPTFNPNLNHSSDKCKSDKFHSMRLNI